MGDRDPSPAAREVRETLRKRLAWLEGAVSATARRKRDVRLQAEIELVRLRLRDLERRYRFD